MDLKFDNVEDGWNNFRKTTCEVADGILGKKVRLRILVKILYQTVRGNEL